MIGIRTAASCLLLTLCCMAGADEKVISIEEVMKEAHNGPKSILTQLNKQLRTGEPDWIAIEKNTNRLLILAMALGKNEPPKGEKASWTKLTKQYLGNAKKLNQEVADHDKAAAIATRAKLGGSCTACHRLHRPM
jgi:cytochrome c556